MYYYSLVCVVPIAIDMSCVIICPHCIDIRVQTGSLIGLSGNMTILTNRAPGRDPPVTEVGGL